MEKEREREKDSAVTKTVVMTAVTMMAVRWIARQDQRVVAMMRRVCVCVEVGQHLLLTRKTAIQFTGKCDSCSASLSLCLSGFLHMM